MAALRFSHADDSQVDPFNAGEPELPGGEPEDLAGQESAETGLEGDLDAEWHDAPEPDYAPHGNPSGTPHKPDDNYRPPTTRGHAYDAPSTDDPGTAARGRSRKQSLGQELSDEMRTIAQRTIRKRTEKDRRAVTSVIVLLILVVSFGSSIVSCTAGLVDAAVENAGEAVEDLGATIFGDDAGAGNDPDGFDWDSYVPEQDANDEAATAALAARLDELVATPDSGQLHDVVASYLDDKLESLVGYSAEELGIDSDAFATWAVGSVSYESEYSYAYEDGTASSYAKISAPDANEVVWAFNDATSDYRHDNGLWGSYGDDSTLPTDEQRARLSATFDEVLADAEVQSPDSTSFDLELVDGAWAVDEQDLVDELDMVMDLY